MSKIEWTDHTWNPFVGCDIASKGCKNCYAMRMAHRMQSFPNKHYEGVTEKTTRSGKAVWTGKVNSNSEKVWAKPYSIKGNSYVFVNSMSDFFLSQVPRAWRERALGVMADTPNLIYQILTKRPENIEGDFPANIWLGVSVEDASTLHRIDTLRIKAPNNPRFVSAEPLLSGLPGINLDGIAWLIVGGESGPGARPCSPAWVRGLRDACDGQGTALFFKQWGAYTSNPWVAERGLSVKEARLLDPHAKGGSLLDGIIRQEMPRHYTRRGAVPVAA